MCLDDDWSSIVHKQGNISRTRPDTIAPPHSSHRVVWSALRAQNHSPTAMQSCQRRMCAGFCKSHPPNQSQRQITRNLSTDMECSLFGIHSTQPVNEVHIYAQKNTLKTIKNNYNYYFKIIDKESNFRKNYVYT